MAASSAAGRGGRVVLITGASSGIGADAARLFAERGDRVILVARREDRLRELANGIEHAGGDATVQAVDLIDPEAPDALMAWVEKEYGRLDVLVNNAGFGIQDRFEDMPDVDVERMFRVNVLAPMALARASLPLLRKEGGGSIVNVASVGGVMAHPLNVAYCASKHALVGFSKSLRLELWGTGIDVVCVCPGATDTEFFDVARRDVPFDPMIAKNTVPALKVAAVLVRAAESRRALIFPTWGAWFLGWAEKWLPWAVRIGNVSYRDRVLKAG
ncbi:MAG: SDR family oxidoreductase [Deltaproteobacteria bacterium]|nr:SDR family oxidoreductase [Deltaproteobacteria bacterium]